MIIEKTTRKGSICAWCHKKINSKYRMTNGRNFWHLSCAKPQIESRFERLKVTLKELKKKKYQRIIMLEKLGS